MYQLATIIHTLARVDFTPANSTGFVSRVIYVMIVILKAFSNLISTMHLNLRHHGGEILLTKSPLPP